MYAYCLECLYDYNYTLAISSTCCRSNTKSHLITKYQSICIATISLIDRIPETLRGIIAIKAFHYCLRGVNRILYGAGTTTMPAFTYLSISGHCNFPSESNPASMLYLSKMRTSTENISTSLYIHIMWIPNWLYDCSIILPDRYRDTSVYHHGMRKRTRYKNHTFLPSPAKVVLITMFQFAITQCWHGRCVLHKALRHKLFRFRVHIWIEMDAMHIANDWSAFGNKIITTNHYNKDKWENKILSSLHVVLTILFHDMGHAKASGWSKT